MTTLAKQIAADEYTIDSKLVAEAIIRKLRMVKWARQELVSESDRTHRSKLRGP